MSLDRDARLGALSPLVGLALALATACAPPLDGPEDVDVVAQELDGVWVFTYAEAPDAEMHALHGGEVAAVDGCLQVGDAVVIWHDEHLAEVEAALQRVTLGESIVLQVGGGGLSLDEGSTLDEFPQAVRDHCAPRELWYSARDAPTTSTASGA